MDTFVWWMGVIHVGIYSLAITTYLIGAVSNQILRKILDARDLQILYDYAKYRKKEIFPHWFEPGGACYRELEDDKEE